MCHHPRGVKRAVTMGLPELTLFKKQTQSDEVRDGNPAVSKEKAMDFASLCLFLGVLFAFATLILKVVEVARDKK